MMNVIHRPASSFPELIERLALFSLMALVACWVVAVDGLAAVVTMLLRCIAVVLIGIGATALLTGVLSIQSSSQAQLPRESAGPSLPRIEVESAPRGQWIAHRIGSETGRITKTALRTDE